jgi:protein-S-isoprenylcysteine O-methyltransferase Ste14
MKTASILAFALMVVGIVWLYRAHQLFSRSPVVIAVQLAAVLLMIWARITFGGRSFHAAANPTAGGIVTSGPYAYIRHPIYAAALYFTWTPALRYHTVAGFAAAGLIAIGGIMRMLSEERLLVERYPEYRDYMRRVKRVVPFVL